MSDEKACQMTYTCETGQAGMEGQPSEFRKRKGLKLKRVVVKTATRRHHSSSKGKGKVVPVLFLN
jgi:hypothetical protein